MTIRLTDRVDALLTGSPLSPDKAGFITLFGGTGTLSGWQICDGSAISRTTYSELFAVIGTAFGVGDNSTTFNVPTLTIDIDGVTRSYYIKLYNDDADLSISLGNLTVGGYGVFGAGSVTVPSIGFIDDADGSGTGIYRVAANSLGFTANGVNVGQYSSAGAWTLGPSSGGVIHTIRGDLLLQNISGAQPTLQLSEDPDNGTNKIIIQAPATLVADYTLTLPVDDGIANQVLQTDGVGILSWITPFTNPMTTLGDMIYGDIAGAATRLIGNTTTTNKILTQTGDGINSAAPAWNQIDNTGYFAAGAEADGSNRGVVSTGTQTIAGTKTFSGNNFRLVAASGGAGNNTSPYMTPSDDTNTGLYFTGADSFGFSAGGTAMLEIRATGLTVGKYLTSPAGLIDIYGPTTPGANEIIIGRQADGTAHFYNGNTNGSATGESSTAAIFKFRKDSNSNRSINAAGTINASGADYAEYMHKARPEETIQKGEVCGVNSNGKLTKRWSEAISFVVKSTDPSYVGGDTWSLRSVPNEGETWAELMALVEIERAKVDRVAFCGQVPCIVSGSFSPGNWIVPAEGEEDTIIAVAISDEIISFSQYKKAIGQVWAALPDGKAILAVGLK